MIKRMVTLVCVIAMLFTMTAVVSAQNDPPQWVVTALAALSSDVGRQLTISNLTRWSWEQVNFPDASLGCPKQGQTYAQTVTPGYIVKLVYSGVEYDYRVSINGSVVFQCSPGAAGSLVIPPTTVPAAQPVIAAGTVVCPGSLATRVAVGMTAKSVATVSLNIRDQAGATGANSVRGLLLPGGTLNVIGGPTCVNNATWWNVTYQANTGASITGWVAEGDAVEYWLEPVGGALDVTTFMPITAANAASLRSAAQFTLPQSTQVLAFMPPPSPDAFLAVMPNLPVLHSGATLQSLSLTLGNAGQSVRAISLAQKDTFTAYAATLENNPAQSGQTLLYAWEVTTGSTPGIAQKFGLSLPFVANDVRLSANGRWMAVTSGTVLAAGPGSVYVWETATGVQVTAIQLPVPVSGVAFSPDGQWMAVSAPASKVYLFQTSTWSQIAELPGGPCLNGSECLVFSPNSRLLAVGEQSGSVQVYDMTTQTLVKTLAPDYEGAAAFLSFSLDSSVLAVGIVYAQQQHPQGRNTTLALWDVAAGSRLVTLDEFDDPLSALAFRSEGRQLIAVGQQSWRSWGVY